MSENKKKKEKTVYIDDGSTISDMSALGGRSYRRDGSFGRPTFRDCFRTYICAVKMMLLPMLVTIGIIAVAFLLIYLIL
jgi:hypothetical protein